MSACANNSPTLICPRYRELIGNERFVAECPIPRGRSALEAGSGLEPLFVLRDERKHRNRRADGVGRKADEPVESGIRS